MRCASNSRGISAVLRDSVPFRTADPGLTSWAIVCRPPGLGYGSGRQASGRFGGFPQNLGDFLRRGCDGRPGLKSSSSEIVGSGAGIFLGVGCGGGGNSRFLGCRRIRSDGARNDKSEKVGIGNGLGHGEEK